MMESPENQNTLTPEQEEFAAAYMAAHPDVVIAPEARIDCTPYVAEFETLVTSFEQKYDLTTLHALSHVSPSEYALLMEFKRGTPFTTLLTTNEMSRNEEVLLTVQEPALQALKPIAILLNTLKEQTNITESAHNELKARYRALSRAVGMINTGIIDHTR